MSCACVINKNGTDNAYNESKNMKDRKVAGAIKAIVNTKDFFEFRVCKMAA